jgi:hypothetical protein
MCGGGGGGGGGWGVWVWGVLGVWVCGCVGVWVCGGCGGCGGVGCCRVGSLLTFDIPQTALVATLDTYDLFPHPGAKFLGFWVFGF